MYPLQVSTPTYQDVLDRGSPHLQFKQLTSRHRRRGFSHKQIEAAIVKPKKISRPQALTKRQNKNTETERILLVLTYNQALPSISTILLKDLKVLHLSVRCRKPIQEPPMAAFRRPTNLKDMLVHSTTAPQNNEPGFSQCNNSRCKTCPNTIRTFSF